jgi:hypothetical protein
MTPKEPASSAGKTWRGGARPPAGQPAPQKRAGWTEKPDQEYERSALRHRAKIVGWSLLFLVLIVGFVVWLIWTPMRTPFLISAVTNYGFPIPPNAWAKEDAERFSSLDKKEVLKCFDVRWESKELGLRQLRQQLDGAQPGGPDRNLIVIYLSMHGAVNGAGEPCLLPPGALPWDSSEWLSVRSLLDYLFPKDRAGKQPERIKKLLILDCNRMTAEWSLGLLYNGFAERLQAVVEEANIPNLVVLNSTSPGQVGWAAPELKGSVFGYFLWQGLKGAADAETTGNHDKIVALRELTDYLKAQVRQWVTDNRGDVQEPMLLPPNADFPLVYAQSREQTLIPEVDPLDAGNDPRWKEIYALWQTHSELRRGTPYRRNPLGWAEFERKLLRLEQLVMAGKAYADEYSDTKRQLDALAPALAQNEPRPDLAAYSLPLAGLLRPWPTEKELASLPAPWKKPAKPPQGEASPKAPPPKPEGEAGAAKAVEASPGAAAAAKAAAAKALEGEAPAAKPAEASQGGNEAKKPPPKSEGGAAPAITPAAAPGEATVPPPAAEPAAKPEQRYGYLAAASASWNWLLDHPANYDKLPEVFTFVGRGEPRPKADVVEIHFLRMLDQHLDPLVWQTGLEHVRRALRARNLAEQAAAPADERVHYWVEPLVDQADGDRRGAEDRLFVGSPGQLAEADRLWKTVSGDDGRGGTYQEAIRRADEVAAAMQLRDRAWAEVPYLAQWLLARLHKDDASDADLRGLIESTQELGAALDESPQGGAMSVKLQDLRKSVAKGRQMLETAFSEQCSHLQQFAGEDKLTLQAIDTALSIPLVTSPQREELREKYFRAMRKRISVEDASHRVALPGSAAAETDAARPYLERLQKWEEQPALMILGRAKRGADAATAAGRKRSGEQPPDVRPELARQAALRRLADQGEKVRGLLQTIHDEAEKRMAETTRLLKQGASADEDAVAVRTGRSQADRLVRAAAPVLAAQPWSDPGDDPVHQLRNYDLFHLLLWQCRRTLDDLWGPAPKGPAPYFEVVAQDYLQSARALCRGAAAFRQRRVNLPELSDARAQAVRSGIRLEAKNLAIAEDASLSKHGMGVALPATLPNGEAAVYLLGEDEQPVPVVNPGSEKDLRRRMGVTLETSGATLRLGYLVPNDSRLAGMRLLHAVALYRGNVYRVSFSVERSTQGLDIAYVRPEYHKPKITVYGETRQRVAVMFIFDCSGSMGARLGGVETNQRRIDVAHDTLVAILRQLAGPDQQFHVGLMIYGHRARWKSQTSSEIVPRRPQDKGIHPSADVELVLSPGRFGKVELDKVTEKLDWLEPMGETPLYLSIIEAFKALRTEAESQQRYIVVITDGVNEQSSGGPPDAKKSSADIERALKLPGNQGIRLDIVGFELRAADPSEERKLQDLKDLAHQTGGDFYSAVDSRSLLRALRKSLALAQYVVQRAEDGSPVTPRPLELGTTAVIDQPVDRKLRYVVRIEDPERPARAEFELEGGEALELYVKDDPRRQQRRLVHHRYEPKELRDARDNLPDPLDPQQRFFVAAHLPDRRGSLVSFPISVQNADAEKFSPRPAEAWVQIRPVMPKGGAAAPLYTFYDLSFQPERPVPVLSCVALTWPEEAKEAQCQLWFKPKKTEPDKVISLGGLQSGQLTIDGLPGVTIEAETKRGTKPGDPYRVIVTEQHPVGSDLYSLKVEMDHPPPKILHRFNPEIGVIHHEFFYEDTAAGEIRNYSVRLTTRKRLEDQAVTLPQPLVVTIPRIALPLDR